MARIRWLCGLWFLAGAALALVLMQAFGGAQAGAGGGLPLQDAAQESYVRRLSEDIGLTPDQQARLRMILIAQELERLQLLRRADAQLPAGVRDGLAAVDRQADQRIRILLRPEQLARYTAMGDGRTKPPSSDPSEGMPPGG